MKVLILGASGMLGHMLFAGLLKRGIDVYGSTRTPLHCCKSWQGRLRHGINALDLPSIIALLDEVRPNVLVNAVGLIRQLPEGQEALPCLLVNAVLPHQLLELCRERGIRLIHYSTDCVFDGKAGRPYTEEDRPTATDIYGLTKFLGEVSSPPALTIRTSIIGPELRGKHSLVEWFLAQKKCVSGYTEVIYTGLPTSEHVHILAEYILPRKDLYGLFQVAAEPISKHDLLSLVAAIYQKDIQILPDSSVKEDKRLSGEAFYRATGYIAPPWPEMIAEMHRAHQRNAINFIR